jgi:large subunit ribosomal protein L3
MLGLIGKKIGMTQLFAEDGTAVPVTAIEAGPCPIVQVKTEDRDGYQAVQIGFGRKKPQRSRRPELGHSARAGLDYVPAITREFKLGPDDEFADDPHTALAQQEAEPVVAEAVAEGEEGNAEGNGTEAEDEAPVAEAAPATEQDLSLRIGKLLTVTMFAEGERVKVTGETKGRGFQGVIKRHGFSGFPKSHGHPEQRLPGSLGPGTDPSRVIKGRKMSGHMGANRKTLRNLTVVKVDPDRNLIFVKGPVPGARNGWVFVRKQ